MKAQKTHLIIGQKAPAIHTVDQDGATITLDQYKGKKIVLYFYPKDNTPGCTTQSCNLRDNYDLLLKKGYVVLGVSNDSAKKHQNFRKKHQLPFPLLVDTDKKIVNEYGVYGAKKLFGVSYEGIFRITFIIDEKGIIEEIIDEVTTSDHTAQILHTQPKK